MSSRRFRLGIRTRTVFALLLLVLVPFLFFGVQAGNRAETYLNDFALESRSEWLHWIRSDLEAQLRVLRADARTMADYPPVQGLQRAWEAGGVDPLDGSTEELWLDRMETLFEAYGRMHPACVQVRYLDATGRERVRINSKDGTVERVLADELQDKSQRPYFINTINLPEESVYFSPVSLNIENGEVDPELPVLRVSTPVRYKGTPGGIMVINTDANYLLSRFLGEAGSGMILAESDGTYLYHDNPALRWGQQMNTSANLYSDWPSIDVDKGNGVIKDIDGHRVLLWTTINVRSGTEFRKWVLAREWDTDEFYSTSRSVTETIMQAALLGVFTTLIIGIFFSELLVRPLKRISSAARAVEQKDYSVQLEDRGASEYGDIARAFNQMTDAVRETTEQLQNQNVILEEKVQERTRDLEEAKVAAEAAADAKANFLANMSHEIRTPMNGVLGMGQLLLTDVHSEEQRARVQMMVDSGMSLLEIINDILDFSKIEAGKLSIESTEFDLKKLVDDIVSLLLNTAKTKGIKLRSVYPAEAPTWFLGDPTRIRQILTNLVGNAIKFTSEGHVHVETKVAKTSNGQAEISVRVEDSGIGMDPAQVESIFEEFTQADVSTTRKFGGTGLGLAISSRLADMMGGRIVVESSKDEGSTFTLRLTLPIASETKAEAKPASGHDFELNVFDGLHVLVAEDNPVNQVVAAQTLGKLGCEVDIAENGLVALEMIAEMDYDLVFMDIRMPVLDGYAAAREIRNGERNRDVPIVALTANATDDEQQRCFDAGMTDFVSKPITISELHGVILKLSSAVRKES